MKNQVLSIEQMKHLKELGVDTSKASMTALFFDENGESVEWDEVVDNGAKTPSYEFYDYESEKWKPVNIRLFDVDSWDYDRSYREDCGVFTLQDILEMMPKKLKIKVEEYRSPVDCLLMIDISNRCIYYEYMVWGEHGTAEYFSNTNLLISTYQMLCWLAENGYLTKKEE